MSAITYEEARLLTVARIREWIASLPPAQQAMPRIVIEGVPLSPLNLLREVEMDTELGKHYVAIEARAMGYVVA